MKRFMLLVALCLAALSCTQEAELAISPDVSSFQVGADGGQFDAIILTNGLWTATCEDESVTLSPDSGDYTLPIHVHVGPNEEHYTKVIRIALTAKVDKLTRTNRIVVTQQCRPFIICDETEKTVGPEGDIVRFEVNSNDSWHAVRVDGTDACLFEPEEGGPNRTDFAMLIPENPDGGIYAVRLVLDHSPATEIVLTVEQLPEGCL